MSSCTLKEAYVSKMVKVNDTDRWSLIALGSNASNSVELKFVDRMKRKYEFSVDSFHIMLDTLFLFQDCARMSISDNFYPTVVGESVYGDFEEALYHLHKKLIATKSPEEIRGGGLLKYCNLLVKNYRPALPEQVKTMERYMCSRFFIDFPNLTQQHNKLIKFLENHFQGADMQLKYDYLMILYQVVDESTVCLMGHERRQTLALIQDLSCQVSYGNSLDPCPQYFETDQASHTSSKAGQPSQNVGKHHSQHGTWSSASSMSGVSGGSWSSSSSSSSSSSAWGVSNSTKSDISLMSGQYSPMSTSSTCSPSLSPKPTEIHDHPPPLLPHKFSVPPPTVLQPHSSPQLTSQPPPTVVTQTTIAVQHAPTLSPSTGTVPPPPPVHMTNNNIPTYEIVTSCQPSVVYSNGYYYTSFTPPTPPRPQPTQHTSTSCYPCSCSCSMQAVQIQQQQPQQHWVQPAQPMGQHGS